MQALAPITNGTTTKEEFDGIMINPMPFILGMTYILCFISICGVLVSCYKLLSAIT